MKNVLVISPHLDDAAFSLGPLIAKFKDHANISVATPFTQSVSNPQGFALACQLDKGLGEDIDYMALRRAEDFKWSRLLGAHSLHGALVEAPHRGYDDKKKLFGEVLSSDDAEKNLTIWFTRLVTTLKPLCIFSPLSIGHHVDHVVVLKSICALQTEIPIFFYKDEPYASKHSDSLPLEFKPFITFSIHESISSAQVNLALKAVSLFESQIPFQFGNVHAMEATLRSAWKNDIHLISLTSSSPSSLIF